MDDALRHDLFLFLLENLLLARGLLLLLCHTLFLTGSLLLSDRCAARPFAGARVRMGALAARGETLAMAQSAITADVHQPLYVQLNRFTQIAFDGALRVDYRAYAVQLIFSQVADFLIDVDLSLTEYARRARFADAVYVGQSDL